MRSHKDMATHAFHVPRSSVLVPNEGVVRSLAYCDRVQGRADGPGNRQSGGNEKEVVDLVRGTASRQFVELEDLAHGQPHDGNADPVPGLVNALAVVRTNLNAPRVGGDRRNLLVLHPI